MDRIIQGYAVTPDNDLMICGEGVAYQADNTPTTQYDDDYLSKVDGYDGTEIAVKVNRYRCEMLGRYITPGCRIADVGAGSGAFVRDAIAAGFRAEGMEVIPAAIARLVARGHWAMDPLWAYAAVTAWDVIEHTVNPEEYISGVAVGCYLFISIPVFRDLNDIRSSKHYRPGEHLYYWTPNGFVTWLRAYSFRCLEMNFCEVDAGREGIGSFAFIKE